MGELDFENSSQAKYWMFDEESLLQCREEACSGNSSQHHIVTTGRGPQPVVRKAACGYAMKKNTTKSTTTKAMEPTSYVSMSPQDQETLVHFHAHQIQRLIGPNAIFPDLRRGTSVLSTAIMLFRRFYLSNSVIDFHPRKIAAASALLAVKTDCERRIPVSTVAGHIQIMVMS
jgi:cyclin H